MFFLLTSCPHLQGLSLIAGSVGNSWSFTGTGWGHQWLGPRNREGQSHATVDRLTTQIPKTDRLILLVFTYLSLIILFRKCFFFFLVWSFCSFLKIFLFLIVKLRCCWNFLKPKIQLLNRAMFDFFFPFVVGAFSPNSVTTFIPQTSLLFSKLWSWILSSVVLGYTQTCPSTPNPQNIHPSPMVYIFP